MKKTSALMIFHLAMMAAMVIGTVGGTAHFLIEFSRAAADAKRFSNLANVFLMLVVLAMLVVGTLYLLKGYNKQAAVYYKLFLILNVAVCILTIWIDLRFYHVTTLISVSSMPARLSFFSFWPLGRIWEKKRPGCFSVYF